MYNNTLRAYWDEYMDLLNGLMLHGIILVKIARAKSTY